MQQHEDVVKYLKKKYYKREALPPISSHTQMDSIPNPEFQFLHKKNDVIILNFNDLKKYRFALIYPSGKKKKADYPLKKLLVKVTVDKEGSIKIPSKSIERKKYIAVRFLDFYGRESEPIVVHLSQTNQNDSKK